MDGWRHDDDFFVGRESEVLTFSRFLDGLSTRGDPCGLVYVRGIGGAGKSWLARRLVREAVDTTTVGVALTVDCGSLSHPDLASLIRLLARAAGDSAGANSLLNIANRLDQIGAAIYASRPPATVSEDDVPAWLAAKAFLAESMTFLTSAVVEARVFGQVTSSASSAVVAGVRALSQAARSGAVAASRLIDDLRGEGILTEDDRDLLRSPETEIVEALVEMLRDCGGSNRVVLWFDKAEVLEPVLYRLVELITEVAGEQPLVAIFSGRLTNVVIPSGDRVEPSEHLNSVMQPGLDMELRPFGVDEASDLLLRKYRAMHNEEPPAPPDWLSRQLIANSDGLPLWLGLLVEDLVRDRVLDWSDVEHSTNSAAGTFRTLVRRIIIDIPHERSENVYRILVGLAVTPQSSSSRKICRAAGYDTTDLLDQLDGSYSFMRGNRLHDTARAVLRSHIAGDPDDRPVAAAIAAAVRAEADFDIEAFWSEPSPLDKVTAAIDDLDLRFWVDPIFGLETAIAHAIVAFSRGADWIAGLLQVAAWHISHASFDGQSRRALTAASHLCGPQLFSSTLSRGLPPDVASTVYAATRDEVTNRRESIVLIGQSLLQLDQFLTTAGSIPAVARIAFVAERMRWLAFHGLDDDVLELGHAFRLRLHEIPAESWVRRTAGEALAKAVTSRLELAGEEFGSAARSALDEPLASFRDTVAIYPPSAIGLFHRVARVGRDEEVRLTASRLSDDFLTTPTAGSGRLGYCLNLAAACLAYGLFEQSERLYAAAIAEKGDLLLAWLGRSRSLWASGRLPEARRSYDRGIEVARQLELERLNDVASRAYRQLFGGSLLLDITSGNFQAAEDLASSTAPDAIDAYGLFVFAVFSGDTETATMQLERLVELASDPAHYTIEVAILQARKGRADDAYRLLARKETAASPFDEVVERSILRAACSDGLLEVDRLPVPVRALAMAAESEDGGGADDQA